jgi:hypothetical protein
MVRLHFIQFPSTWSLVMSINYTYQHIVVKQPDLEFIPSSWGPSFIFMLNNGHTYGLWFSGTSDVPRNFFGGGGERLRQEFFRGWGSTNSVEDGGERERGSWGGSPLVRGFTRFANEWNPYSDYVVMDVYSTELGIRLSFVISLRSTRTTSLDTQHAHPQYSIDCSSIQHLSKGTKNTPWRGQFNAESCRS